LWNGSSAGFYDDSADEGEIPQKKELVPDVGRIVSLVADFYHVGKDELYASRRGRFNEPRNVAVYLTRKLRRDKLTQIGENFAINSYSSVSSIIGRMEECLQTDAELKKRVAQITNRINTNTDNTDKGQEQT